MEGWYKKGSRPTKKYILNKSQKIHVFGALDLDATTTKLSPKINSKKYSSFLKRLRKHHQKLCVIIDNAQWHHTKKTQKYCRQKKIKVIRLLPYSPELNPIEQYWKNIKQWLGTRLFYNLDQLKKQIRTAIRNPNFIPKTYQN